MSVVAIVLAAGASRRLGQPKQLVTYRGETLLARSIRIAREAGASTVFVVLGAHFNEIVASVSFDGARLVLNELWEKGMSSSIHAGLRAAESDNCDLKGILIVACDQPHLTPHHLRRLIAAFNEQTVPAIVASQYADVRGIPAVFPRCVFQALYALEGDKGARSLLSHPPCPLAGVNFPAGEADIDLPTDLAQLE